MAEMGRTTLPQVRISGDGKITWEKASASSKYLLEMRVAGDSYPRFRIRADGQIEWGSGSATPDIELSRFASGILSFHNEVRVVDSLFHTVRTSGGELGLALNASGDSDYRFMIHASGQLFWGSGSSSPDCTLSRRAANILNTPDRLEVGTLGVGNSAAGSTLGNVVKKIEVFDDAGNSLGFLAVYDSIT